MIHKELEALDRNSMNTAQTKTAGGCMRAIIATQMLVHQLDGIKKIERYCDLVLQNSILNSCQNGDSVMLPSVVE